MAVDDGIFKQYLLNNVPTLQSKFWPTFWCVESRAQTVFASILRQQVLPRMSYRRELLSLKDGGQIALDWMENDCDDESPVILILPGLTGASQSEYIKCLVKAGNSLGARVVVFNNRGLGGVELKVTSLFHIFRLLVCFLIGIVFFFFSQTPRLYSAANLEDLSEVIDHLSKTCKNVKVGATGISMGGLVLGNYLATHSEQARKIFTACKIISVPWDVQKGTLSIEKPYLNSMLGKHLTSRLCRTLAKYEILNKTKQGIDFDTIFKSKTIKEFDANFTTKHFGYKSVDHYYSDATLHNKLHKISVPLLCLSAADDPFQPLEGKFPCFPFRELLIILILCLAIPTRAAEESSHVAIIVTARGGHIGFLDGVWPKTNDEYMARLFGQYFGATLFDSAFDEISKKMLKTYPRRSFYEHIESN